MKRAILASAVLLAGCALPPAQPTQPPAGSSPATASPSVSASPSPTPTPTEAACRVAAEQLSLAERAGQVVMVGVSGSLDSAEAEVITDHHLGSVILMGGTGRGLAKTTRLTDSLQRLAGDLGMLVAVDQEGGLVQRLTGSGFDDIPAAAAQADWSASELADAAGDWGDQLAQAGVQLNLAPVADVVPRGNNGNEPVAGLDRGYGSDPEKVSGHVLAFMEGMHAGGVATAVKHFPGLGAVRGNTDFAAVVVDKTTTADSDLLIPFHDAVEGGTEAVMVSSAIYQKIDPDEIAAFSPAVIDILRGWGFEGVVISDDLGVAEAVAEVPADKRAVRFLQAGGDLALTVDPAVADEFAEGLVERAEADPDFAERLTDSAARVLELKQGRGLADCG